MLDNLLREAKLTAMNIAQDVKDVVHDATTKLPDDQIVDFKEVDKQSIQPRNDQGGLEYMNNGWGMMASTMTANQIDMIADKMNFVANMIQNGLLSFDAIETELRAIAMQPAPPQPAQLVGLAARIDTSQRQTFEGLQELRRLAVEVDKATDKLQNKQAGSGWNVQPTSMWK